MRIIVCGTRGAVGEKNYAALFNLFDDLSLEGVGIVSLIHGDCNNSPDMLADAYAIQHGIPVKRFPADWEGLGKSAGFIRNRQMAALRAEVCVAVWDGKSRGTLHMITEAVKAGSYVRIIPARMGI